MKKRFLISVLSCMTVVCMLLGLGACTQSGDDPASTPTPTAQPTQPAATTPEPTPEPTPGGTDEDPGQTGDTAVVTANTAVHYAVDTRTNSFGYYAADGTLIEEFKDMYQAIASCVENGDEGDYVAKLSGDDAAVALFINRAAYASDSTDQFYYYENGTSLDRYTPWKDDYHTDLGTKSKNDLVLIKTINGLETYRQGYEVVSVAGKGGVLATWNVYPSVDANIQVDLEAYCGITKAEYTIDLSEAKIYPAYEGYQPVYAKLGFISPDAYNIANFGLYADTTTGNWYYYYGNGSTELYTDGSDGVNGIVYETEECYLTSTWNEEGGYFSPDSDVKLTAEIIEMTDEEGSTYYVDRLTAEFDDGRVVVRDYEHPAMTACSTLRFSAALDIYNTFGMPMYDNGAQFTDIRITSAVGTVYPEVAADPMKYGGNVSILLDGTYDLLNSNEASEARYHTVIYNNAVADYNFDTAGCDVYSFSFRLPENQPAYSSTIRNVKELIAAIPAEDALAAADEEAYVIPARTAYDALVNPYQSDYITADEFAKLTAAEAKCLTFHYTGAVSDLLAQANELKTFGPDGATQYCDIASLTADAAKIEAAYQAYAALSEDDKAVVVATIGTKIEDIYNTYIGVKDLEGNLYTVANSVMWMTGFNFDDGMNLYNLYTAYTGCTEEELAQLPQYHKDILAGETVQNGFKAMYAYLRTREIVGGWITALEITDVGGFAFDDAAFAKIPEAELAEVAGLWTLTMLPSGDTWNFRVNYAGRWDGIEAGGFEKYWTVLSKVLDYKADDNYSYNGDNGLINSSMDAALAAAAAQLWGFYVDENTVAGVCDMDASVRITELKNVYEPLNEAQKAAVGQLDGGKTAWAIAHRDGEYTKMNDLVTKAAALDSTASDYEDKVNEIAELFNTLDAASSYFFRESTSQWIPADGVFVSGAYTDAWNAILTAVEGRYVLEGSYLVKVSE